MCVYTHLGVGLLCAAAKLLGDFLAALENVCLSCFLHCQKSSCFFHFKEKLNIGKPNIDIAHTKMYGYVCKKKKKNRRNEVKLCGRQSVAFCFGRSTTLIH